MAVTIARTSWVDDDGTGTTGTIINNAVKTSLYDQIDGALAQVLPLAGGTVTGVVGHTANVGIGTASPEALLHVHKATAGGEGGYLYLDNSAAATLGSSVGIAFANSTGGAFAGLRTGEIKHLVEDGSSGAAGFAISTFNGASAGERVRINAAGYVGIGVVPPTAQLHTTGTVRFQGIGSGNVSTDASGNVTASDGRLKETVGPLPYGLAEVLALEPIVYKWKPESGYELEHEYAGFNARALAPIMPLAAPYQAETNTHWLNDRAILGALVNAVRELAARIR